MGGMFPRRGIFFGDGLLHRFGVRRAVGLCARRADSTAEAAALAARCARGGWGAPRGRAVTSPGVGDGFADMAWAFREVDQGGGFGIESDRK